MLFASLTWILFFMALMVLLSVALYTLFGREALPAILTCFSTPVVIPEPLPPLMSFSTVHLLFMTLMMVCFGSRLPEIMICTAYHLDISLFLSAISLVALANSPVLFGIIKSCVKSAFEGMTKKEYMSWVWGCNFSFISIFALYMLMKWGETLPHPVPIPPVIVETLSSSSSTTLIESAKVFVSNHPVAAGCGVIVVVGAGALYLIYRFCGG